MRLILAAVGKAQHGAPEQDLFELHCDRARGLGTKLGFTKLDCVVVDTSRASARDVRTNEEAKRLTAKSPPGAHCFALDESGRSMTSEDFARHLAKLRNSGLRDCAFFIGGPDGLAASLKKDSHERLAFGPQTWPHLLVRAMLAEQIYRAFSILAGHPYH